jgi:hypothetical protein
MQQEGASLLMIMKREIKDHGANLAKKDLKNINIPQQKSLVSQSPSFNFTLLLYGIYHKYIK